MTDFMQTAVTTMATSSCPAKVRHTCTPTPHPNGPSPTLLFCTRDGGRGKLLPPRLCLRPGPTAYNAAALQLLPAVAAGCPRH